MSVIFPTTPKGTFQKMAIITVGKLARGGHKKECRFCSARILKDTRGNI
jgi:hypothetical protein